MLRHRRLTLSIIGASVLLWYTILIFVFDLDYISRIRHTLNAFGMPQSLDAWIDETISDIGRRNIRFSRPFDVFGIVDYLRSDEIPRYFLGIDPRDLSKLEFAAAQTQNIPRMFLIDELNVEVPAVFRYQDTTYRVKVRYRGDSFTHWAGHKKSWKITFVDPPHFQKQSQINLIIPEQREFLNESVSNHVARKLNLYAKNGSFVSMTLNNENQGIYYQSEEFNTEFLQKRGLVGTLYGDLFGDVVWSYNIDLFANHADWKKIVADAGEKDVTDLARLIALVNDNTHANNIDRVIDLQNFVNWQTHMVLMGSTRQNNQHNMKLLLNRVKGVFEFLPDDVRNSATSVNTMQQCNALDTSDNQLVHALLSRPEILLARNQRLWKYISNDALTQDDLDFFAQLYRTNAASMRKGLREATLLQFEFTNAKTAKDMAARYRFIKKYLKNQLPTVVIKRRDNTAELMFTTDGAVGFSFQDATLINAETGEPVDRITLKQEILPRIQPQASESDRCNRYQTDQLQQTIPCSNCRKTKLSVSATNLVTGETVSPEIIYE